ncbi:MAG: alpha/beta fold hydrolase [Myxococcota bacterium]
MNHTLSAHAPASPGEEHTLSLWTERGEVVVRFHPSRGARAAVLMVGGVGGDWDTPAHDLYPRLCQELPAEGMAALRVRFRHATDLREAVYDVLAALRFLDEQGIERVVLLGHSFGGAVIIQAAESSPEVTAVITLATQSYGTNAVSELGPECAALLIHGLEDHVLPFWSSEHVYEMAREPRKLVFFPGNGHTLQESADAVHHLVHQWVIHYGRPRDEQELAPPPPP